MPEATLEIVLVFVRAYLGGLSPEDRLAFLRRCADEAEELVSGPMPIREGVAGLVAKSAASDWVKGRMAALLA